MGKKDLSRRSFIRNGSLAGLGVATIETLNSCSASRINKSPSGNTAGWQTLRARFHRELFDRFLPAMDQYCIDHEYGGFMCDFNISTRKPTSTTKRTWYQGRGIWVYSYLYNNFKKDETYLKIAKDAIDFILKLRPKGKEFWDTNYGRDGKIISEPGDIYGNLFVAEGLAEYAKAVGDKKYFDIAKEIVLNCVERYDQPDYVYNISYVPGKPKISGPRVLGHWMIFLSISSQILSHWENDADFIALNDRCIDAIMIGHMNKEFQLLNEVVNHDFSVPDNEFSDFLVIGHSMETLVFVMEEAVRRKDAGLFERSRDVFKRHVEVAADKLYGGYFEVLYNANTYDWSLSKSAWCQQEISRGALLMIEHEGNTWERVRFSDLDEYLQKKMARPNFAFWTFGGERKVEKPNLTILEHYHTPRYLMRSLLAFDRIIERSGNVSGLLKEGKA
jgi:mannose/cellobiose epimerase-like protein (N-acyl-D-glucosamine 2-epimerase family)